MTDLKDNIKDKAEKYELELISEQAELANRINELNTLIENRNFNDELKEILNKQLVVMKNYRNVLIKMINMVGYMQIKKELNE